MARAADTWPDDQPTGLQIGRGGFLRDRKGRPWVTDPTGALVKSGERKGEIKRLMYGSPSNFGKTIENTTNLQKWGERRLALGIGLSLAGGDYELLELCHGLARLDVDSDEYKTLADQIVVRSKEIAEANLAANRGTHTHALTEDNDEDRDWIARAEAGEDLGIPTELQAKLVEAWQPMLADNGLCVMYTEASVVDDRWRLAGTLDRIVMLSKDLRFLLYGGEVVTIPAKTVLVLDVKTGRPWRRNDGTHEYWQGYAVQIASYAQSVPYDREAETRGEWPAPIDQDHALIAHLDVAQAIATGEATCELIYVDLAAGRRAGELVVAAKAWANERTTFSVARMIADEGEGGGHSAPSSAPVEGAGGAEFDTHRLADESAPSLSATEDEQRVPPHVASEAPAADPTEQPPTASPTVGSAQDHVAVDASTREDEDGLPVASRSTDALGATSTATPSPAEQRAALTAEPDEGGPVDIVSMDALKQRYLGLDKASRAWVTVLTEQAQQAAVSFHTKGHATRRRFEIVRGLTILAETESTCDDEIVRAICASILGDVAQFPSVTVGHVVGSLNADEAATFARRCDALAAGEAVGSCDDVTGALMLAFGAEEVSV